jgi:isoquinoline 1-oxidoreductase alpha subunit
LPAITKGFSQEDRTLFTLTINGQSHEVDVEPDTPLLWVLRDTIGLTGTKFGCGIAACGACTVHVDGAATRSCQLAVQDAVGSRITTIEGLSPDGLGHPVQRAWLELDVPQCGYCQSGQIMAAAALLAETPKPSDDDIAGAMTNLCRCGTYQRIRAGVRRAVELQSA